MNKEERKRRAELCKKCYFCEQGVDKTISVDDMKGQQPAQQQLTSDQKKELCKKCYFCEQGVDKNISIDDMKAGAGKVVAPAGESERDRRAKLCRKCYFCEQGVDKSISIDDQKGGMVSQGRGEFCWYLFPTNGCNLRCKYCYANNKPGRMTQPTMHKMLDWLFRKQPHKNITCHFFGGEPTVCWDMLVDIVEIGNKMAKENKYNVIWSMTTNGVLLDKDRLDWIASRFRPGNPFLLSIDGRPKTHNKYRVLPGNKPSYDLIPVDEIIKMFPDLECRPTIEPDTAKDWFEDFRFLRNKGFKAIAIEPDFEAEWTEQQLLDYENALRKLGKYYVYAQRVGQPIRMKWIEGVIEGLGRNEPPGGQMCGVAFNCAAIDHRGKLYACQRYASYNEPETYAIGDVEHGFDEYKLFEAQSLFRENVQGDIASGNNCKLCEVRQFCYKGCNAAHRKFMGSRHIVLPRYCTLTKIEVRVALSVLAELNRLGIKAGETNPSCGCKI